MARELGESVPSLAAAGAAATYGKYSTTNKLEHLGVPFLWPGGVRLFQLQVGQALMQLDAHFAHFKQRNQHTEGMKVLAGL